MDEEQLDNGLVNHIREVFDNFEDPGADEGWLKLREKYPEEKKDRGAIWLWWGSAAAVLFLCLGLWFFNKPIAPSNIAVNPKQAKPSISKKPLTDTLVINDDNGQNMAATASPVVGDSSVDATGRHNSGLAQNQPDKLKPEHYSAIAKTPVRVNPPALISPYAPLDGKKPVSAKNQADSIVNKTALAQNPASSKPPVAIDTIDSGALAVNKTKTNDQKPVARPDIIAMMNDQRIKAATNTKQGKKTADKALKKAMFSVYAATYFNYAKGSDNQVNVGAGFTSDFSLSKNLKFSTGLAITQNSLSYDNGTPQTHSSGSKAFADVPTYASSSPTALMSLNRTLLVSQSYNANMVGLDIPLNLKFEFNPKKSDTFISAGLSSGTFINERYRSTLNYSNLSNNTAQSQEQTTTKNFGSFDFAKTLNLSFGVGAQVGKTNRLIIEPFLKYPLDGLGAEQIRFGAGGINLKLNFQTKK